MSTLKGVRVIRGPDWKWDDQDGGKGNVGTVIDTQSGSSTRPVTVVWDSGFKGHYRAGPKGCYDLRVVGDPSGEIRIGETIKANRQSTSRSPLDEWIKIGARYFWKAINQGDFENAQLLYNKHNLFVSFRKVGGRTVLHLACIKGHKDIVRWLVKVVKMDVEEPDDDGYRPIHHAIQQCEPEVAKILIQRGAQMDVFNNDGVSPLHTAVNNGFTKCVRLLIESGCNVNIQDADGSFILHSTISSGTTPYPIIQAFTSSGRIDWKLKDSDGFNVLQLAVIKNDFKVIESIFEHMDQDCLLECLPGTLDTVLHYACAHRNFKVAKLLLTHKMVDEDMPSFSCRLEQLLEATNASGMTALLIAVSQKDCPLIELLVDTGADIKAADENGNTGLILAAKDPPLKDFILPQDLLSPVLLKDLKEHPALFFFGYLIEKGFCWNVANSSGLGSAFFLLKKGYSKDAIAILNWLSSKRQISTPSYKLVQVGCIQQPEFPLTSPRSLLPCNETVRDGSMNKPRAAVSGTPCKRGVQYDSSGRNRSQEPISNSQPRCSEGTPHHHEGGEFHLDADPDLIDLERDLKAFAKQFARCRIKLGVTQKSLGDNMCAMYGERWGSFSQSTISRFETYSASNPKSFSLQRMCELRPLLQKWLEESLTSAQGSKRKRTAKTAEVNNQAKTYKKEHS